MLTANAEQILERLAATDLVLDVGGWASPFPRADWVLDLLPYETRGLYAYQPTEDDRFSRDTWVERDICDRTPWPFADQQFDFAICSHTLEDVRDPVWVCEELRRVAKAGYIEVPSRLEEQTYGLRGSWVGWAHHHWLVDVSPQRIEFVLKNHALHGWREAQFAAGFCDDLSPEDLVQVLWWEGSLEARERVLGTWEEIHEYLVEFVETHAHPESRTRRWRRRRARRG